jgi:hypothetical protein
MSTMFPRNAKTPTIPIPFHRLLRVVAVGFNYEVQVSTKRKSRAASSFIPT